MSPNARTSSRATPRLVGVIDIGTNSVKLAVGYAASGRVVHVHAAREPTRLGQGLVASGGINPQAVRRTAAAVSKLAADARRHGAVEVIAVGTWAFRAARNGRTAARAIARRAGIPVRILSGAGESAAVLRSVRARLPRAHHHLLVVDIGGGSAELIVAHGSRRVFSRSLPLGAVRLTEMFLGSDPVAPDEYAALNKYIEKVVAGVFTRVSARDRHVVVSGGTATTAAAMLARNAANNGSAVHVSALRALEARCLQATVARRRRFKGLLPDRADIIPAGLAVLLAFVRHSGRRSVRLIEGGVRDGVMLEMAERARRAPRRSGTTVRAPAAVRKGR